MGYTAISGQILEFNEGLLTGIIQVEISTDLPEIFLNLNSKNVCKVSLIKKKEANQSDNHSKYTFTEFIPYRCRELNNRKLVLLTNDGTVLDLLEIGPSACYIEAELVKVGIYQLFFKITSSKSIDKILYLYDESRAIAKQLISLKKGTNWCTFKVSPLVYSKPVEFKLVAKNHPTVLWGPSAIEFKVDESILRKSHLPDISIKNKKALASQLGSVLMIDFHIPKPDRDAGSYAAFNEIRLIQSLGYHVLFVPLDLAYVIDYTERLETMGVEVFYEPKLFRLEDLLNDTTRDIKAAYITRYNVATQVIDLIRKMLGHCPIVFNNADLHFLRELRIALNQQPTQQNLKPVEQVRDEEIRVMNSVDAILSYTDSEHAVIASHLFKQNNIFKCPWVVEEKPEGRSFYEREGIAFLGNYKHLPNQEAVDFLLSEIVPLLSEHAPHITLYLYGSDMPVRYNELECDNVKAIGYVENLDVIFNQHRALVVPLLSGAGIKGKVLESLAYGLPCIVSQVAAEGTGISHQITGLIANTPSIWLESIVQIYSNKNLWHRLSVNQKLLAREQYSFEHGRDLLKDVFRYIGLEFVD